MEYTKLLIEGSWVNRGTSDEPKWELMVHPIVTKLDNEGIIGSFVLFNTKTCDELNVSNDAFNRLLSGDYVKPSVEPARDITLHNLGEYTCEEGYEWVLYMTTKIPYVTDNAFAAQIKNGQTFLDFIKPGEEDDDLDRWIYERLTSLTAPHTIRFKEV